jgi:hypothetical protein
MGGFNLTYFLIIPPTSSPSLMAVKIYSEPSHTLLAAFVQKDAPVSLLQSIRGEKPRQLRTGTMEGAEVHTGMASPEAGERRIRVEVVVTGGKTPVSSAISDVEVRDIRNFEFTSEFLADGSFKHSGVCGGTALTPLVCMSPAWALCCPGEELCPKTRCGP